MSEHQFKYGDRVVHALRPEWGPGVVTAVQNVTEEGRPAQRLTLRFDRAGLKTISTAHAHLRPATPADEAAAAGAPDPGTASSAENGSGGWLARLESRPTLEVMMQLPEATSDPFASLASRLKATFNLYRFSTQGASLLDWAAMQTGMRDPLSRFSRHELEQYFQRFAGERDAHLKKLVLEAKKSDDPQVRQLLDQPPPAAKDALRRIHAGR